jgi:23S rRNA-/tRNA-specific pseudouridylate synthase
MKNSTIQFLKDYPDLKTALRDLGISGQKIKKCLTTAQKNLRIKAGQKYDVPVEILATNNISPNYQAEKASHEIKIIKEDEFFLAVEKPHRVHSYPLVYGETDNTLSFLRECGRGDLFHSFEEYADRNLVFRLDYETAGVLLFSKQQIDLKSLRQSTSSQKIYALLVDGEFGGHGNFKNYYRSVGKKGEKVECFIEELENARVGSLEIFKTTYDEKENKSLVLVRLISGVRHQLRSFFEFQNSPIVGDELYGGSSCENLCLHACFYQVENFKAFSRPLFLRNFLDLDSRFQVLCDEIGIS